MFLTVFPFLCPRANHSHRSSLILSFLKSDLRDSLPSLFTKEQLWPICSGRSWQKSDESDSLFFMIKSLFRSQKNKQIAHPCINPFAHLYNSISAVQRGTPPRLFITFITCNQGEVKILKNTDLQIVTHAATLTNNNNLPLIQSKIFPLKPYPRCLLLWLKCHCLWATSVTQICTSSGPHVRGNRVTLAKLKSKNGGIF